MTAARTLCAAIALAVLATLAVRVALSMEQTGGSVTDGFWAIYRFFTIWTNTLVGLAAAFVALGRAPSARVQAGLLLAIGLVAVVYHTLLAPLVNYEGLEAVADQMVHTVVPLAWLVYWFAFAPKADLGLSDLLPWMAYPLVYSVYALARGQVDGIYPYPFLDAGNLGLAQVGLNILGLLAAFGIAGLALLAVARLLRGRAMT